MALRSHFKIILIGNANVGKTALITRYKQDTFIGTTQGTVGVDLCTRSLPVGERQVDLTIWDTAGQERMRAISRPLYRNADAAILMYSIADAGSFANLGDWLDEVREHCPDDVKAYIVGGKSDLPEYERQVTTYDAMRFARDRSLPFYETSAKDGAQVTEVFNAIVTSLVLDAEERERRDKEGEIERLRRRKEIVNLHKKRRGSVMAMSDKCCHH